MVVQEEKSEDHLSQLDSSSGHHKCLYNISFSAIPSETKQCTGGPSDQNGHL